MDHLRPIHYQLSFFIGTTDGDAIRSLRSITPFMAFQPGDIIDPRSGGYSGIDPTRLLLVTGIMHSVTGVDESHILHSISVVVKSVDPKSEPWRR